VSKANLTDIESPAVGHLLCAAKEIAMKGRAIAEVGDAFS